MKLITGQLAEDVPPLYSQEDVFDELACEPVEPFGPELCRYPLPV